LRTRKQLLPILILFILGVLLYVFAVLSSFWLEFYSSGFVAFAIIILTCIGGLGTLGLGYASVIILGGMMSLKLNEFIARVTMCKQVIEVVDEKPRTIRHRVAWKDFLLYMPVLVFILSVILAWDIHNLHDPQTIFHPLLHALDVFARPIGSDHIWHSVEVILAMIVLITIVGVAPSIALPYFRRFKTTGVNSGPFHTNLLFLVVGLIVGLGTLLTLIGFLYQVLWVGKGPIYYHYVFLAMLGLSLHYTIGAFLGRDKSEEMIITRLRTSSGKRVVLGTVSIQGSRSR